MRRRVFAILVVTTSVAIGGTFGLNAGSSPAPRIEEDEPGWVCEDMGNRICGPISDDVAELERMVGSAWHCWAEPKDDGSSEALCARRDS